MFYRKLFTDILEFGFDFGAHKFTITSRIYTENHEHNNKKSNVHNKVHGS